ncbi:MAG TPA: hypothetical protein V6D34_14150 [Candidatus Sericytochromatia bacterium]
MVLVTDRGEKGAIYSNALQIGQKIVLRRPSLPRNSAPVQVVQNGNR